MCASELNCMEAHSLRKLALKVPAHSAVLQGPELMMIIAENARSLPRAESGRTGFYPYSVSHNFRLDRDSMRLIRADGRREARPKMCASELNCMEAHSLHKLALKVPAHSAVLQNSRSLPRTESGRTGLYPYSVSHNFRLDRDSMRLIRADGRGRHDRRCAQAN